MRVVLALLAVAGLLTPSAAAAENLHEMCWILDASPGAACGLELVKHGDALGWQLSTGLVVNGGSSADVKRLEARFCAATRRLGITGWVNRWNQLPASSRATSGAAMAWSCGLPAVSAAPAR